MGALWIALYGIIYTASEKISAAAGTGHGVTVISVGIYMLALGYRLYRSDRLPICRLQRPEKIGLKNRLRFLPLLLLPLLNLVFGGGNAWKQPAAVWILTFYTVLAEELLFRGYFLSLLEDVCRIRKKDTQMLISSAVFGSMHLLNMFRGERLVFTAFQVLCAFFAGMIFCMLVFFFNSLFPGLLLHYLINMTSCISGNEDMRFLFLYLCANVIVSVYICLEIKDIKAKEISE